MAKKKTPAIVAKVEKFILVIKTVLEGLFTEINEVENRDVEEFDSRLSKMTLLAKTRRSALETVETQQQKLETFSGEILVEIDKMLNAADRRVEKTRTAYEEAQHKARTNGVRRHLEREIARLEKSVKRNEGGLAHQDKLLAGDDLSFDERKLVQDSRLDRIAHLNGVKEELKAKQEELRKLQVESDRGLVQFARQSQAALTRQGNIPGERAAVHALITEMRDALEATLRDLRKEVKKDENKVRHLKEKAAKQARRNAIEVQEAPEPVEVDETPKSPDLETLMREVAKELDVDMMSDPETHRAVRELTVERLKSAA